MCVSLDGLSFEGLAYYRGLTHLGVNTARVGALSVDAQKQFFDLLKPTVLVGAPSVLKKLALELGKTGFNPESLAVKKIFCTGESIRTEDLQLNGAGKTIEEFFNAKVYSTYGNTELSVSYCECCAQRGGHSRPELVYTEIVDHKGDAVPDGTAGELVATPLGVEGLPLVRYKTGDISFKVAGSCDCGRNSMRIGPILGRTSTIIRMKGTTVYPLSITNVLDEIDGVEDYIIIVEDDEPQSDRVSLHVVTPPSNMENIVNRLRTRLGAAMPVLISNIATIQHYRGKSSKKTRILDNRKLAAQRSRRLSA
jgi:phenylacetate-CoA ligase